MSGSAAMARSSSALFIGEAANRTRRSDDRSCAPIAGGRRSDAEELPSHHLNVDNDESVFVHHDESGSRKPGMLSHTPRGILHGVDEATRTAFQKRRTQGMRRTLCGVSTDTDRPLGVSAAYDRLTQ